MKKIIYNTNRVNMEITYNDSIFIVTYSNVSNNVKKFKKHLKIHSEILLGIHLSFGDECVCEKSSVILPKIVEGIHICEIKSKETFDNFIELFSNKRVYNKNYNPTYIKHGEHSHYYGCEIELNVKEDCVKDYIYINSIIDDIKNEFGDKVFFTVEGFNNCGFEVATHPMGRIDLDSYGYRIIDKMLKRGMVINSNNDVHFHVSSNALGEDIAEVTKTMNKILIFLYNNSEDVQKIRRYKDDILTNDCPCLPLAFQNFNGLEIDETLIYQIIDYDKIKDRPIVQIKRFIQETECFTKMPRTIEFRIFATPNSESQFIEDLNFVDKLISLRYKTYEEVKKMKLNQII